MPRYFSSANRKGGFVRSFSILLSIFWVGVFLLLPAHAWAGSFEGTLQNLVNALVSKILPILAFGYLGKNVFAHIQGSPIAKDETIRVVIAIACLLGINSLWSYIQSQVR
jgi:hypothetical protein